MTQSSGAANCAGCDSLGTVLRYAVCPTRWFYIGAMKRFAILLVLFVCVSATSAQSRSSWQAVRNLHAGTGLILVDTTGKRIHCELFAAEEDRLICDCARHRFDTIAREAFDRADIRQIRRTHQLANRFAGFALGLGITAIGGVKTLGTAGAPVGAAFFVGGGIPVFPSTLLYQRPSVQSRKSAHLP